MVIMDNNTIQKPASGDKYIHRNGTKAIKDGIKVSVEYPNQERLKKPKWFKVNLPSGENFLSLKNKCEISQKNTSNPFCVNHHGSNLFPRVVDVGPNLMKHIFFINIKITL